MATQITRDLLKTLRDDIDQALAALAQRHGLVIKAGNATFSSTNATFKLSVATVSDDGVTMTKEMVELRRWATPLYKIAQERLDQPVVIGGKTYWFAGLKSGRSTRPFIMRRADGKLFAFPAEIVQRAAGALVPARA